MEPQAFNLIVAILIGAASSYVLKYAPASWKGKPMVLIAIAFSILLEGGALFVTGQLQHFSVGSAADILMALAGQRVFFDMLKDDLQLQDPPAPAIAKPPIAA